MNIWFVLAGISAFAVCLTHLFLGGKEAARPLLESLDLRPIPKYTNYYCWHMVSIAIAALGGMLMIAAYFPSAFELAWTATLLALSFSLWNISLYFLKRNEFRRWFELPQWLLFLPVWVFGFVGLLS